MSLKDVIKKFDKMANCWNSTMAHIYINETIKKFVNNCNTAGRCLVEAQEIDKGGHLDGEDGERR